VTLKQFVFSINSFNEIYNDEEKIYFFAAYFLLANPRTGRVVEMFMLFILMLLNAFYIYLLTYSMEQSPS
jgi:hypothetical protein